MKALSCDCFGIGICNEKCIMMLTKQDRIFKYQKYLDTECFTESDFIPTFKSQFSN